MRIIRKDELEFEEVFPYFIRHVGCGKTLSSKITQVEDFREGNFFTILPDSIDENRLLGFDWGIIPPSDPHTVITTTSECCDFIKNFFQKNRLNCAITGDYVLEPSDTAAQIDNVKMIPYETEVYYLLNEKNSEKEISRAIRSGEVWYTLIVLTSLENADNLFKLDDATLDAICENTQYVLAGAYDGESYIF